MTCDWPPPVHADPDGYLEIRAMRVSGPGQSEAEGTTFAWRIQSPCRWVRLEWTFISMINPQVEGHFNSQRQAVVLLERETVVVRDGGTPWRGALGFIPDRGEAVLLSNGRYRLDGAACAS
jgi:hypothetical protein